MKIDVIVPVYNAFLDLRRCLRSLRETVRPGGRLRVRVVLIDDASTDPRVRALLEESRGPGWVLLRNARNQGFVRSVNRGLSLDPEADVVLLNSDTVVTPGWLEALAKAAYEARDVATVTPLSNQASIYSWPLGAANESLSIEEFASVVRENSPGLHPTIPTGVGFCLYIKRSALKTVGGFDEDFGHGYGEEDDFCMRAKAAGMRHVLADDVFVFHKGGASMKALDALRGRQLNNKLLLHRRHPELCREVSEFLSSGVMDKLRRHLEYQCLRSLAKPRMKILYALHKPPHPDSLGGVEHHTLDLLRGLSKSCACYAFYPGPGGGWVLDEWAGPFQFSREFHGQNPEKIFWFILKAYGIQVVHVQHLLNQFPGLIRIAKEEGCRVLMSMHDYYSICPRYDLLTPGGRYCGLPSEPLVHRRCLAGHLGPGAPSLTSWRRKSGESLRECDRLVFFSRESRRRLSRVFPLANSVLLPHGIPLRDEGTPAARPSRRFSVCFLGVSHVVNKGADLIRRVVPDLLAQGVAVHFLGSSEADWMDLLHWKVNFRRLLHFHGRYHRRDVVQRLKQIAPSLVALLSPWPETYSYTFSEARAAGIPLLLGPLGAPAERARREGAGVILKSLTPEAVLEAVLFLKGDRMRYLSLLGRARKVRPRSDASMAEAYRKLYGSLVSEAAS